MMRPGTASNQGCSLVITPIPLMRFESLGICAACAAFLVLSAGCASSIESMEEEGRTVAVTDMSAAEALYWQRQEAARSRYTQAEVDFMTGMIGHHAQALIMSGMAPENAGSNAIRILAARIINAQNDEIATMQRWLRTRGEPVPEVHIDGLNLMVHIPGQDHDMAGGHDHAMMPGMLTRAQLEELAAARGAAFDRLFLTYMIQHHEGATSMVDDMFATDGAGNDEDAFRLATDINVDQETEIARMRRMLEAMTEK